MQIIDNCVSEAQYIAQYVLTMTCSSSDSRYSPDEYAVLSPTKGAHTYDPGTSVSLGASSTDTNYWIPWKWTDESGNDVSGTVVMDGDKTRNCVFSPVIHTVSFYQNVDETETLIASSTCIHGGSVTPPTKPTVAGYTPGNWSGSYTNVTEDRKVTCYYTECGMFVTANADGSAPYMHDDSTTLWNDGTHYAAEEDYQFTDIAYDSNRGNLVKTAMPADGDTSEKCASWYSLDGGKTWYASNLSANRQTFVCAGMYNDDTRFLLMSERNEYGKTQTEGGIGGITYYSSDGATWTKCNNSQELNKQYGFAYLNVSGTDRFIKAEYCGGYDAYYSDNGGVSWTQTLSDYGYKITCVRSVGSQFVMGSSASRNLVSDDGISWTRAEWDATTDAHDFARGNGVTIAVCDKQIMRTTDTDLKTATWTSVHTHTTSDKFTSVAYGNGKFIAVARVSDGETDVVTYVSTDGGLTWSTSTSMCGANRIVYNPN